MLRPQGCRFQEHGAIILDWCDRGRVALYCPRKREIEEHHYECRQSPPRNLCNRQTVSFL